MTKTKKIAAVVGGVLGTIGLAAGSMTLTIIDQIGRVLVVRELAGDNKNLAAVLSWLVATPWWVPGLIAAFLAAGILNYLYRDSTHHKTENHTPQLVTGTATEHYVVERAKRLEEELRLRDVELRERENREKSLGAEFESLQRKHRAGQNTLEKWIELFEQSTELRSETSAKWQQASEVIAEVDAILGDSGTGAGKGLLGRGSFDPDETVPAEVRIDRARDVIWAFYDKRASQLPSPPGGYFEAFLNKAARQVNPSALPGIQLSKSTPSAPPPAIAAPSISPADLNAPCPCGSGKTLGSCHGRSDVTTP